MVEIGLAALAPWPLKAIVDNVLGGHPFPGPLATVADTLTNGSVESLLILVALSGLLLQLLLEVVRGAHTQFAVDTGQRIVYDLRAPAADAPAGAAAAAPRRSAAPPTRSTASRPTPTASTTW